jgi:outer membrane protein OmpA-like peptidoglycan-associated protein
MLLCPTHLLAQDSEGCKDSPLITRFPGSEIRTCEDKDFNSVDMPIEDGTKTVEGEYHNWDYAAREGTSSVQVFRNFQAALKSAGFTVDFADSPNHLTAHKGNAWIALEFPGDHYYQTIVLTKDMQQEVTADAASLGEAIEKTGHVAVYGINFDTGKATLRTDSEAILEEIHKLLIEKPALKLRIEGHTDSTGTAAGNQSLSEKRAQAVVTWLTAHDIAANRLSAAGLGQTKPIADNGTDEGRAKNRRVELVRQ